MMLKQLILLSLAFGTLSHPQGRIVGGKNANIEDYPWQVSIELLGKHHCGGCILTKNFIATAAHCTNKHSASDFAILVNSSIIEAPDAKRVFISEIHQSQRFNATIIDYDFSILKLTVPLIFGTGVQPIKLPTPGDPGPFPHVTVTVTGWGQLTEKNNQTSVQLQVVEVEKIDTAVCEFEYSSLRKVFTACMMCAGIQAGGKGTCVGDGGSPLIHNNFLYGLVSWGNGCAKYHFPGVYTNIVDLNIIFEINKIIGL